MIFEWEEIEFDANESFSDERAKVHGGWILKHTDYGDIDSSTMVFIPDPYHKWSLYDEFAGMITGGGDE